MTPLDLRKRTIVVLLALFVLVIGFKIFHLRYAPGMLIPISGYKVEINMQIECEQGEIQVISALPTSDLRQTVFDQQEYATALDFTSYSENGNRFGRWVASQLSGPHELSYAFSVKTQKVIYQLPDSLPYAVSYDDTLAEFLRAPSPVQISDATRKKVLSELQLGKSTNLIDVVRRVYDSITHGTDVSDLAGEPLPSAPLHASEANAHGKGSLFVSWLRTLGIPARSVGGLILHPDKDAEVHYWAEACLGNRWVPFDPAYQHYAELPATYLTFHYGDEAFFQHTSNVNLDYAFTSARHVFPMENDFSTLARYSWNIMNAWPFFQRSGVSLDLLRLIIMIPVGAVVTIIFRNVIGVKTFGTFLPVLIASSFQETGLWWGLLIFVAVILVGAVLGSVLHRLRILYAPRLTIILVYVVVALFFISIASTKFANVSLGQAALFPLAVLAITIEGFSLMAEEAGVKKALSLLGYTILTVVFCYLVINSIFLQTIVLAFPETMLLVIGVSIYLGAWKGLRLNELLRFRKLIFNK